MYAGFGSVGGLDQAQSSMGIVVEALRQNGQRGILASGWGSQVQEMGSSPDIYMLGSVPHTWLFPRVACAIHHGGAGTIAAAFKAGIPSVVVPHGNDQFAWGKRVYELGAGSEPVPVKQLSVRKLSEAIRFALTEPVRSTASILGEKVRMEHGAVEAAGLIIDVVNRGR